MRQSLFRPKIIIFILLSDLVLAIALALLFPQPWLVKFLSSWICPGAVYFQETSDPIVALTIDDSPNPQTTDAILQVLAKHQVKATFFPISDRIQTNPQLTQAIVDEGHEVGNHLTTDEPSIKLGDRFPKELAQAHQILSEYAPVKWLRPGSGFCNAAMVKTAKTYDYQIALGSVWSYDTHLLSSKFANWFITTNTKPGSIIVLHDGETRGSNTAKTLQTIIPKLQQKGYRFVTLSELATAK